MILPATIANLANEGRFALATMTSIIAHTDDNALISPGHRCPFYSTLRMRF